MKINLKKASDALRRIIEEAGGELPENQLAIAVINQAITDIFIDHRFCKKKLYIHIISIIISAIAHNNGFYRRFWEKDEIYEGHVTKQKEAFRWINHSPDFGIICDFAYLNEEWVSHLINSSYDKYIEILNSQL